MMDLAFPGVMTGFDDSQDHFQHKWFSDFTPHSLFFFTPFGAKKSASWAYPESQCSVMLPPY